MRNKTAGRLIITIIFSLLGTWGLPTASSAQQNLSTFNCLPVQVATYKTYTVGTTTYPGRVWVLCNPPLSSTQQYFAVPFGSTSLEAAEAARFLSLFTAAFVAGKTIEIGYIPGDNSGLSFNCTTNTLCYPAISATIR